ncbi:MAG TPA: helix-hairpin-helix domain-containing protein [Prosthecobacter sp.]|nr:helix-hairpin-helix domain-containing protein [Prosthecobacter sp.]
MKHLLAALLLGGLASQAAPPPSAQEASAELKALAASLNAAQAAKLITLANSGDTAALSELPGIGPVRAAAIQAARPFNHPLGLLRVTGIGEVTLTAILKHAKANFPRKTAAPSTRKKKSPGA